MDYIDDLLNALHLENTIKSEDIPNVDLYVDQVVQLFENSYGETTRTSDEKVLTKTMINNYAKGKLFFPVKNKKYTREHIMLIALIYQLKGALSINDIKNALSGLNKKIEANSTFSLESLFKTSIHISEKNVESFKIEAKKRLDEAKLDISELNIEQDEYLEKFLLLTSFVSISNLYRRLAEKLVDELSDTTK